MSLERLQASGRCDRGAVAVETALVAIIPIMLLFGIIDSSFLFKDWLTVSAAARAGARMGASEPRALSFAQDSADQVTNAISGHNPANIQEVWVYKASPTTGLPSGSCGSTPSSCVKFTWNSGTQSLLKSSDTWAGADQDACIADRGPSAPLRDSVGVYVKYKHTSPLGFFFNDQIISESTVMWIEPWTPDVHCKPGA
jgi:hypothetical protein